MSIEDKFEIAGRGVVVTGRIETGEINVGDTVIIQNLDNSIVSTVVGIEMFRKLLDRGEAGDNVGLLLKGVTKEQIDTNSCLIKAGEESSTDIIMRCPNCGRWVMCDSWQNPQMSHKTDKHILCLKTENQRRLKHLQKKRS